MQVLLIRGIITIILAISTILIAVIALYYYLKNEPITKKNVTSHNIYGPTFLLFAMLIANIINLILYAFLFYTYGVSSITLGDVSNKLHEKCDNYTELGEKIRGIIKSKYHKLRSKSKSKSKLDGKV